MSPKPSLPSRLLVAALCATLLAAPAGLCAQDRKAEQAIKHRRAAFTLMSTYFGRLLQTVEGHRPYDPKLVAEDARMVELLSRLPWEGFAPGTERGQTRAKEDIWFEEERFSALARELERETAALSGVAATGRLELLRPAFERTRAVCTRCHKAFRSDP